MRLFKVIPFLCLLLTHCVDYRYHAAPVIHDDYLSKTPDAVKTMTYVVQPNDSLYSIAFVYEVDSAELAKANQLASTSYITPGQKLYIPPQKMTLNPPLPAQPIKASTEIYPNTGGFQSNNESQTSFNLNAWQWPINPHDHAKLSKIRMGMDIPGDPGQIVNTSNDALNIL